MTGQHEPEVK